MHTYTPHSLFPHLSIHLHIFSLGDDLSRILKPVFNVILIFFAFENGVLFCCLSRGLFMYFFSSDPEPLREDITEKDTDKDKLFEESDTWG